MSIQIGTKEGVYDVLGTKNNDTIGHGYTTMDGKTLSEKATDVTKINGLEGDDVITTGQGHTLAAGDMVGDEWQFVDGKWVYTPAAVIVSNYGADKSFNDIITTGAGNDVVLGNRGDDILSSAAGDDIINAGSGDDKAFGGSGNDTLNLEDGNDYAEGGVGNDIINGGDGDDVIYGDIKSGNLLQSAALGTSTLAGLANSGAWTMVDSYGTEGISQSAQTVAGETYTISFELAANLAGGHATGAVEVIWNGEVVKTVETKSGVYETFKIDVTSTGDAGELSFRAIEPSDGHTYNFEGPIVSYEKQISLGGESLSVNAFAAGQAKLYQVIDGHLHVFDAQEKSYIAVGQEPGFKINAVGFNVEDDLIYGVAKSDGTDSLGNTVNNTDIVMIDATGATFRVGEGFYSDYVGDFDDSGNLWTFHSALNRISVVDVDSRDANNNPEISHFKFPSNMFTDRTYDLAFNAADGNFYAVVSPGKNGQAGKVVKIDISMVTEGGQPSFTEVPITGTLYGDQMKHGMAKGAYGAVFLDGDGNLYYGLNKGDHDLNPGTDTEGAIFKVNVDWEMGQAYSEFMSEAPSTGSNDGAVDPRSVDAFSEIDANAAVLLREPVLIPVEGGNDDLRGGAGNDEMHGNEGDDTLSGGTGDDVLFGGEGNDNMAGGADNDTMSGGTGADKMRGETGDDIMNGEAGDDYLSGGTGDDTLRGGDGADKLVGGKGSDRIDGGDGNDHLWGGEWTGDGAVDTFVFTGGDGKDYIHDFEAGVDLIDLSAFATDMAEIKEATRDLGWATVIDLHQLDGGEAGDMIVLKAVQSEDLTFDTFIF